MSKGEHDMAYVGIPNISLPELESERQTKSRKVQEYGIRGMRWGDKKAMRAPAKRSEDKEPAAQSSSDEERDRRFTSLTAPSIRRSGGISKAEYKARRAERREPVGKDSDDYDDRKERGF